MRGKKLGRRMILQGMGAAAASIPFLRFMPSALAQSGSVPKRFVVFFSPNEPINKNFWKTSAMTHGQALEASQLHSTMRDYLSPYVSKLTIIGDMSSNQIGQKDTGSGGHRGIGWMLTGVPNAVYGSGNTDFWGGGISLDYFIAKQWNASNPSHLYLSTNGGGGGNGIISYKARNERNDPYTTPNAAFNAVFAGFQGNPDDQAAYKAQRRRLLDTVSGNVASLQSKLPKEDKDKLEQQLEAMAALESKLDTVISCEGTPVAPENLAMSIANFPRIGRLSIDVMVQALSCNVARVGVVQLGNSGGVGGGDLGTPQWPNEGIPNLVHNDNTHKLAHDFANLEKTNQTTHPSYLTRIAIEKLYYKQFAYLLQKLDSVPEGASGETLLDHTVVLWVKNLGYKHSWNQMLYMVAGGSAGILPQQGRYLSFNGEPHNKLLAALSNKLGVSVTGFGDPDFSGTVAL
jgi:hypothetical protein